ncbi:unnamed protein product [Soboliphyme baturini]|uniref:BHLH domain-containing protein n=1 Tax=Soboliphyme baturini TaxID=241478 RepID=A0A183IQZ5_9BILA|nr:unnamed protein product [Soboliphyme baturini]
MLRREACKYNSDEEKSHGGIYGNSQFNPLAPFLGPAQINPGLLSLFSFAPQHMFMSQMLSANQSAMMNKGWPNYDPSMLSKGFDDTGDGKELNEHNFDMSNECDVSSGFAASPDANSSRPTSSPAAGSNFDTSQQNSYSVENMLLSILGMVEMAAAAVRKQEERFAKDKEMYLKRIRRLKDTISHLKFDCLQTDQSAVLSNGTEQRSGQSLVTFPSVPISVACDEGSTDQ